MTEYFVSLLALDSAKRLTEISANALISPAPAAVAREIESRERTADKPTGVDS